MNHIEDNGADSTAKDEYQHKEEQQRQIDHNDVQNKAELKELLKFHKNEMKKNLKDQRVALKSKLREVEIYLEKNLVDGEQNKDTSSWENNDLHSLESKILDALNDHFYSLSELFKTKMNAMEERLRMEMKDK